MQNNAPEKKQISSTRSVVLQWLRIATIASINVIILAVLAAYFDNQQLSLIAVIGIIADSMGIVLGLLGIWFFFLSENLNRTTAQNLDRITSAVDDLHSKMWSMIQQTFSRFVDNKSKEDIDGLLKTIEQLKAQIENDKITTSQQLAILDEVSKKLDDLEKQRASVMSTPTMGVFDRLPMRQLNKVKSVLVRYAERFPMSENELYLLLVSKTKEVFAHEIIDDLLFLGMIKNIGQVEFGGELQMKLDVPHTSEVSPPPNAQIP